MKAQANVLAKRPLHTRPEAYRRYKLKTALRQEHLAMQEIPHKKNEHDRLTGHTRSNIQPGLCAALIQERCSYGQFSKGRTRRRARLPQTLENVSATVLLYAFLIASY